MPKHTTNLCPLCKKLTTEEDNAWRPFCSERCKMIDLGRWAMGEYKVPGKKVSRESFEVDQEEEKD